MHRIDSPDATPDHRFTEGDPTIPIASTTVSAAWLNTVQEELAGVVLAAGLALDKAKNDQLKTAIVGMIAASIPAAPPVASTEAAGIAERATDAEALAGTDNLRFVTPAQLLPAMRSMLAGTIVEWESETIPTLADAKPLGLELNGNVVSVDTFPNLLRKWCGSAKNATAPAWYRCTAAGVRDAAGSYIKLQDRRGEFARGWDHGRGVDTGRVLGSAQGDDYKSHTHVIATAWGGSPGPRMKPGETSADGNSITTNAAGGTETRPRNVATMFIILV